MLGIKTLSVLENVASKSRGRRGLLGKQCIFRVMGDNDISVSIISQVHLKKELELLLLTRPQRQ
jgi:aspartokinase/homoserine dehydrogenase 1